MSTYVRRGRGGSAALLAGAVIATLARKRPVPVPKAPDPIEAEHLRMRAAETMVRDLHERPYRTLTQPAPPTDPDRVAKAEAKRARRAAKRLAERAP